MFPQHRSLWGVAPSTPLEGVALGRRVHTTADTPKLQRNGQSPAELRHPQSPVKFDSKSHRVTDTSLSPGVRRHGPFYQDADYMAGAMSAGRTRSGVGDATDAPTPGRGEFTPRASAPTGTHVSSINPSQECDDEGAETGLATGQPPVPLEVIAGTSPDLEARKWRSTQSRGRFPRESGPAGEGGARPPFEERVGALTRRKIFFNNVAGGFSQCRSLSSPSAACGPPYASES